MLLQFPPFPGRVDNKDGYCSLTLLNVFKNILRIMMEVLGFYRKCAKRYGVAAQLSLPFSGGKWVAYKKVETSNIAGTMPAIFYILSPYVWTNNGLLNKNY